MKKTVIATPLIVLTCGMYLAIVGGAQNPGSSYVTAPVERRTIRSEVVCTGTLRPRVVVDVGSQISGVIQKLNADVETNVEKGQVIAVIDPAMFEARVVQVKGELEGARKTLAKVEATLADAVRNRNRKHALWKNNSISQNDYEIAETQAYVAQAEVDIQKARIAEMEGKLREAELQVEYCKIESPINGVMISRTVDVGQTVAASFQTPVLFRIAENLSRIRVDANVDEADIGRLKEGQQATFTVPAFPKQPFSGVVEQIRNEPRNHQNVVTYTVVIDVNNTALKLRPGMTANVTIVTDKAESVLTVPEQALHFVPATGSSLKSYSPSFASPQTDERSIWKLEKDGSIKPITVRLGINGTDRIQIHAEGLIAGDLVIVESLEKENSR
jgi:HlyD family secretion protein